MAVLGFILIGASALLAFRLHRKLLGVGEDTSHLFMRIPNTLFGPFRVLTLKCDRSTVGQRGLLMQCGYAWFRESCCWSLAFLDWATEQIIQAYRSRIFMQPRFTMPEEGLF
jgi:hypothetical protein